MAVARTMLRPPRGRHGGASQLQNIRSRSPAGAEMAAARVRWCGRRLTPLLKWCFALLVATWCVSLLRSKTSSPRPMMIVNPYEAMVAADEARQKPEMGAMGEMAYLPPELVHQGEEVYKRIALNEPLSDIIPYNRTLAGFCFFFFNVNGISQSIKS